MILKALPVRYATGRVISHTVVDQDHEVHALAEVWLHDLRLGRDCSVNTTSKYAADLAHFLTCAQRYPLSVHTAPAKMSDCLYFLRTEVLPAGRGSPTSA